MGTRVRHVRLGLVADIRQRERHVRLEDDVGGLLLVDEDTEKDLFAAPPIGAGFSLS